MRPFITFSLLIAGLLFALSCTDPQTEHVEESRTTVAPSEAPDSFSPVQKGINIAHWLSQSDTRGQERQDFFQQDDIDYIASLGFDHIRLPVDEEQLWDEDGNKETEAFELLHDAIRWSKEAGLKVVVDLHILRSHYFLDDAPPLFTDPEALEMFLQNWRDLSEELHTYPNDLVAYELLNEAVANDPEDWNHVVRNAVAVLRELEPERTIVIGSNHFKQVQTFPDLWIPEDDSNIILSYHFYTPMLLTHYNASWSESTRNYTGPVSYPGQLVTDEEMEHLSDRNLEVAQSQNGYYNRVVMEEMMQIAFDIADEAGLHLYCAEWGVITDAPQEERLRWYEDMRFIFESNGISYANWNYKSDNFGLIRTDGTPDEELIDVFTKELDL